MTGAKIREMIGSKSWMIPVIDREGVSLRAGTIADQKRWFEHYCDCNVTGLFFYQEALLSPYWKPERSLTSIGTKPEWSLLGPSCGSQYHEYQDSLQYDISYTLVYEQLEGWTSWKTVIRHFTPDAPSKSYRWTLVREFQKGKRTGHLVRPVAVVRNTSIVSLGEYIENRFEVFEFSPGFNPIRKGWCS